jgi:hypothetical protein
VTGIVPTRGKTQKAFSHDTARDCRQSVLDAADHGRR